MTDLNLQPELQPEQFAEFFQELYPYPPMTWQTELAEAACAGEWPEYVCLPTGAGKTSTIDIALFALAHQADWPAEERTAAIRTFLVVDRRTVVSEAFYRAKLLQQKLADADNGILKTVADRLRSYSSRDMESNDGIELPPLSVVELRGGIYRDPAWCQSLTQPMIVTSTVDQVGSRLLFRGYGVSNSARPIQAAAVAHDSLIILDEAHISPAFSETLSYVRTYQRKPWSNHQVPSPMKVVEMTATPPKDSGASKLEINPDELADETTHIGRIVNAPKPTTLEVAEKVKGAKATAQLAKILAERAIDAIAGPSEPPALAAGDAGDTGTVGDDSVPPAPGPVVGIMCNMVATAKEVWSLLCKNRKIAPEQVHLIIGAMRPIDRDKQTEALRELISTGTDRDEISKPIFVVATQCIEVGADYDFDALITEAAPLDSLIQRFGRLNRAGRNISPTGRIVIRGDRVKSDPQIDADDKAFKSIDPIYGNAMSRTWNWLSSVADGDRIDFGIASFKNLTAAIDANVAEKMSTDSGQAPVLLPAHLDLLCQTSIEPWPDPDVSLWLHGPHRNDPEVQVCWRADLVEIEQLPSDDEAPIRLQAMAESAFGNNEPAENAIHTVSLCPPSSSECISLPLRRVYSWLKALSQHKKVETDFTADLPAIVEDIDADSQSIPAPFRPVAWRGLEKSEVVQNVRNIRPGDTLVFPVTAGGWTDLGFVPEHHGWSPHAADGTPLSVALQNAAKRDEPGVKCDRNDFHRLSRLDRGNEAFERTRNRSVLRLHPSLVDVPRSRELYHRLRGDPNFRLNRAELVELIQELPDELVGDLASVQSGLRVEYYAEHSGLVISGSKSSRQPETLVEDDGSDLYSRIVAGQPVELSDHLAHVRSQVERSLAQLSLKSYQQTLLRSAETHDWGKSDPRFQAMLLGGDLYSALWETRLYAKSARMPDTLQERQFARANAELPRSFRHEMLSMSLAEVADRSDSSLEDPELLLHLIATHHGHGRPWVPICEDADPLDVNLEALGLPEIALAESDRQGLSYHRVDSPVIARFWQMIEKYGWWGIAFLETVLRLADRRASQIESQLQRNNMNQKSTEEAMAAGANQ